MNTINAKKISIGILTLLVLIFIQISVNAQTPPISGDWAGYFPNGTKSAFVWRLSFPTDAILRFEDVGAGTKTVFTGRLTGGKITDSNGKTGIISADNKMITWSDGVIWRWQRALPPPPPRRFPDTQPGGFSSNIDHSKVNIVFPRFSYDSNPFIPDPNNAENPWKWNGPTERTIYNPLDGGLLLKYRFTRQNNADGCSAGAPQEKIFFQQACFAHDLNYDAPFVQAKFPAAQALADYLFFKDMQLTNDKARGTNNFLQNFTNDAAANVFYTTVTAFGKYRGGFGEVLASGGAVTVFNNSSAFTIVLRVSWKSPDGTYKQEQIEKVVNAFAIIPLSAGAREIKIECWMKGGIGGSQLITRNVVAEGMYTYTVTGTVFNPKAQEKPN